MSRLRNELARYGRRLAARGMVAGTGGNISAREDGRVWVKPARGALGELAGRQYAGIELDSGRRVRGPCPPSSEAGMHLAVYRARPDARAVFHTHSPWASGIASCGAGLGPLLIETVGYLGRVTTLPYLLTSSRTLSDTVAGAAREHDTILLANHGVVVLAPTLREAFHRCEVVEDAARALVAASVAGTPHYLDPGQVAELRALGEGPKP